VARGDEDLMRCCFRSESEDDRVLTGTGTEDEYLHASSLSSSAVGRDAGFRGAARPPSLTQTVTGRSMLVSHGTVHPHASNRRSSTIAVKPQMIVPSTSNAGPLNTSDPRRIVEVYRVAGSSS